MIVLKDLPHVLAVINLGTLAALATGLYFIRHGDRERHRKSMITASVFGAAFLAVYLVYHFGAGLAKFGGYGFIRPVYFTLLIIHILAAVVSTPLVPLALYRAWTGAIEKHRRLAKWAWGIWFFVAASGLVVYVMAIHLYPYHA